MPLRVLSLAIVLVVSHPLLAADAIFRFGPPDGVRFVRTLTRTARLESHGMMRMETTEFRARFTVREASPGFVMTMTPLSFRYLVNDREIASPVWESIRGHDLRLLFNVAGKLVEVRGYDAIDEQLKAKADDQSGLEPSIHLDRHSIGEEERIHWNERTLLWLNQPATPGTKLEFDSVERSFTGERVKSHTVMKVVRSKPCGATTCVVTTYKMVPDLDAVRQRVNETANSDFIDATASEELEQVIEPATMLPHYERLTWRSNVASETPDGKLSQEVSLTAVSEFVFEPKRPSPKSGRR